VASDRMEIRENGERPALCGLLPEEISARLEVEPFRGRQVFAWIHRRRATDFADMTDLPQALRESLAARFQVFDAECVEASRSEKSGTMKALLRVGTGDTVESVLIREGDRVTLCLSTQVGCPLRCAFCATGAAGYRRNLEPGEIIAQALWLLRVGEVNPEIHPNIVFMGMGEPFYNYDAVRKAIVLLMRQDGLNIGARRITVSTAGDIRGIRRFADEGWQVRLSVSLHAANDALRSELVPLNRRFPLADLRQALEYYQQQTGRQFTFEWTLLDGVNDRPEHAAELAEFARGLKVFVNLISWNPVPGLPFRPTPSRRAAFFAESLRRWGLAVTLRKEQGRDIDAACGQLRRVKLAGEKVEIENNFR